MEPKKVGRVLGTGVRVASKMVRQRVEQAAASGASPAGPVSVAAESNKAGAGPGVRTAAAQRGIRAFGHGVLGPFRHAGGVLWLEITGLFFALFALFFVQNVYRTREAWKPGSDHSHLLLYVGLAVAFAWFSFSSFARAYRKKSGPTKER